MISEVMLHNKLALNPQWLTTAKVYVSFMMPVQHGSTAGGYSAYQNSSGSRLTGLHLDNAGVSEGGSGDLYLGPHHLSSRFISQN